MRERLLLPVLIPAFVAGTIVLLIFSASRILLNIDPKYATAIAICIALGILGVSALLAVGPRLQAPQIYVITAVPAAVIIAIGLYIAVRPGAPTGEAQTGGGAPAATTSPSEVTTDNKYSVTSMTVPAGQEVTLSIANQGQNVHNWRLLGVKGTDGSDIVTKLVQPGQSDTIKFTITQPGTYAFQCDVHPTEMKGTLTVAEGGAATGPPGGGAGAAAGGMTIVATDNKYDKTALTVKANEEATVTLDNKGSSIHNWHVLNVKDKDGKDIATKLIGGGQSDTIKFTITQPSTYDFQCDVHPTEMKGKLTVQ